MKPAALLRCPMVPAVERWVQHVVEPAARQYLRAPLVELKVAASYSCRPRNGISGGKLSEHGHANALDVSGFIVADGRTITVKDGWNGSPDERAFLRAVHQGACNVFTTVLGPHADSFHRDHFHMDLARHGRQRDLPGVSVMGGRLQPVLPTAAPLALSAPPQKGPQWAKKSREARGGGGGGGVGGRTAGAGAWYAVRGEGPRCVERRRGRGGRGGGGGGGGGGGVGRRIAGCRGGDAGGGCWRVWVWGWAGGVLEGAAPARVTS